MENEAKKVKYTQAGFDGLQNELYERKTTKREEIRVAIALAKSFGDLSENAEYTQAREDQEQNEARIRELELLIKNAEIIDETAIDISVVSIGTTVTIIDKDDQSEREYTIVSKNDVNPIEHKISEESPIGKALCGMHEFDDVTIEVPAGTMHFQIRKIEHTHQ